MKVAAYLRVSTDRQAEEGLGLEVQEQAIRAWAKTDGHRIVGWFRDEGVSGSNGLESRLALADAMDALKRREAEGFVVYRLDRLARDLVIQETLLLELKRLGATVFSTSPSESQYVGDDPNDPSRTLIRQMLGSVAQYERSMIALRLRSGRRRKHENGGFAYGSPPYGWRAHEGQLVTNPDEQQVVTAIKKMRAEGKSLREIAAHLQASDAPTKRGGTAWSPTVVNRIIRRMEPGAAASRAPRIEQDPPEH